MQHLNLDIIDQAKKEKMKTINMELSQEQIGCLIECPKCHYISKNNRFSAKIFQSERGLEFKCFACGMWRKIK